MTPDEIERWKKMRTDAAGAILGGNVADLFGVKPGAPEDDTAHELPEAA